MNQLLPANSNTAAMRWLFLQGNC